MSKLAKLEYQLHSLLTELKALEATHIDVHDYMRGRSFEEAMSDYSDAKSDLYRAKADIRTAIITLKDLIQLETVLTKYGMGDM